MRLRTHLSAFALMLLAAATLRAQTLLDIEPGWPREQAMKVLQGKYRIADTITTGWDGYDFVIRMAPVQLAGYDGYLALHSDSTGSITSYAWSRVSRNIYLTGTEPWVSFMDWKRWSAPTSEDYQAMLRQLAPRFEPWPYRVKPMIAIRDSNSLAARNTHGWANDSVRVKFYFANDELLFAKSQQGQMKYNRSDDSSR